MGTPITTSIRTLAITSTIMKTMACPKCGRFEKSGRNSCCAPGGAWFKNCGGSRNRNVDHKWFEGVAACKRTTTTAAIAVSVCPRCGTIGKSGKSSCCGRGGSWFRNCGGTGNTKLQHTWYEGIQACKARSQSKTVVSLQLNGAQQKGIDSSQGVGMANDESVIAATNTFTVTSANTPDNVLITAPDHMLMTNTLTDTFVTSSTHASSSTSITTQGCGTLLKIIIHITLLFMIEGGRG